MPKVKYYEFFQQAKSQNFESTRQIVNSLLRYEELLTYRFRSTRDNDNYWYLINSLELALNEHQFYLSLVRHGKDVSPQYLLDIITQYHAAILDEYRTQYDQTRYCHAVRDTLKLLGIWIQALKLLLDKESAKVRK